MVGGSKRTAIDYVNGDYDDLLLYYADCTVMNHYYFMLHVEEDCFVLYVLLLSWLSVIGK